MGFELLALSQSCLEGYSYIYIFVKNKKKKIIFPDALPENVAHEIYWLSFDDHPKKAFIVVIVLHYFFSLSLLSSLSPFSLRPLLRASV